MEMELACSETYEPVAVNRFSAALEQLQCFGETGAATAQLHLNTFLHLVSRDQSLGDTLIGLFGKQKEDPTPSTQMRFLKAAGVKWLATQSANVDVRSLSANNRGMLYAIGY